MRGWHRPMSISAGLVRRISGGRVRPSRLHAGREREDIHGSEDGGAGEAVRGEGPGCRGDAGEAWRRGLEEGDRGREMDGGRDRAPSGRGAGGGGRYRDRPRVRGPATRSINQGPASTVATLVC